MTRDELREKMLLAISEVHSGNIEEANKIIDVILPLLPKPLSEEAVAKFLASYAGGEITLEGNMDKFARAICTHFTVPAEMDSEDIEEYEEILQQLEAIENGWA